MMAGASNAEHLLARKTAEEYRSKGYEVTLDAPLDFFPGYRADLLARKAGEVTVIEVKSRSSLAADSRIRELARVVDAKPGWSFELLLVAEPEKLDSPEGASVRPRADSAQTGGRRQGAGVGRVRIRAPARLVGGRGRNSDAGCGARRIGSGHQRARVLP